MSSKRCPNGYRKNKHGICEKKEIKSSSSSPKTAKKCPKGYRKNKQKICEKNETKKNMKSRSPRNMTPEPVFVPEPEPPGFVPEPEPVFVPEPEPVKGFTMTQAHSDQSFQQIKKIIKGVPFHEYKKIHSILQSHNSLDKKMQEIHVLLKRWNAIRPLEENRQTFICDRLVTYFKRHHLLGKYPKIIDIGGGNGNVLEHIGKVYHCPPEHLLCVDKTDTEFVYKRNKPVTYMESDDFLRMPRSFHANLILCMVSLHHMADAELLAMIDKIWHNMAPGGHLFIKEHDCRNLEDKHKIDWEHHLYHLMETPELDATEYRTKFIGNYKSIDYFNSMFEKKGFHLVQTFNNILDPIKYVSEITTPTRLYWAHFVKPHASTK